MNLTCVKLISKNDPRFANAEARIRIFREIRRPSHLHAFHPQLSTQALPLQGATAENRRPKA